jgi:sugar phosphate isomerase/epimerase
VRFGTQLGSLGRLDRPAALAYGKSLGCQGLEVSLPVASIRTGGASLETLLEQARAMRADFETAGMEFISLSPGLLLKHAQYPEVVLACCQVAQALGARTIRMFSAPHVRWGGPGSVLPEFMAEFDGTRSGAYWLERNREELARLVELAEGYDLRFSFELHHGYVINSASGALRMIEQLPPERVGILMDPGNMCFEGNEGWRNSIELMGPYLDYIHCKNGRWDQSEDGKWKPSWDSLEGGIASYPEIVTALQDTGFQGYLSIEDLRGGLSAEERIGKGIAYLKGLVESGERVMPV